MVGPVNRLRNWFTPVAPPPPVPVPETVPAPEPVPAPVEPLKPPAPEIDPPLITPSHLQFVNYLRALSILRGIPFKEFKAAFFKLPLQRIAYVIGVAIWLFMTYVLTLQLFHVVTGW